MMMMMMVVVVVIVVAVAVVSKHPIVLVPKPTRHWEKID